MDSNLKQGLGDVHHPSKSDLLLLANHPDPSYSHPPSNIQLHHPSNPVHLSLPLPNFLIDPRDGQFTPYSNRSPISTPDQEHQNPFLQSVVQHHQADAKKPIPRPETSPSSPPGPVRSRATSIVLQKLIEHQAQMLLDISLAWKKKYPIQIISSHPDPRRESHPDDPNHLLDRPPVELTWIVDEDHDSQKSKQSSSSSLSLSSPSPSSSLSLSCSNLIKPTTKSGHLHPPSAPLPPPFPSSSSFNIPQRPALGRPPSVSDPPPTMITRRHVRSRSHERSKSIELLSHSFVDRLSFKALDNHLPDQDLEGLERTVDVEGWKRKALESKERESKTKHWIAGLPSSPADFEPFSLDLDLDWSSTPTSP